MTKNKKLIPLIAFSMLLASCDDPAIWQAKSEIKSALRDPGSAKFRNTKLIYWQSNHIVCGEVNAKNAFGGLTGFNYFVYSDPLMRISSTSKNRLAIYSCCKALESNVEPTVPDSKPQAITTDNIEGCADIDPPMPMYWQPSES